MSSILTNTSAMVALQTLKSINGNLEKTQAMIATGKRVESAKDNAAIWAISKVMESDVKGFEAISESLGLGESTVAVARNAAETVTDLLQEIKKKVVASQEENVDREKIQTDIEELRGQIETVVGSAQFNGLNLLTNKEVETTTGGAALTGSGSIDVLSSLDRSQGGEVSDSNITVGKQDLGTEDATAGGMGTAATATTSSLAAGAAFTVGTLAEGTTTSGATGIFAGMTFEAGEAGLTNDVTYVARDGDTLQSVTEEIVNRLNVEAARDDLNVTYSTTNTAGQITVTNDGTAAIAVDASVNQDDGTNLDGVVGGGLEMLSDIDVTTEEGTRAGLQAVEGLIQTAIDSAAAFGSAESRISIQMEFVGNLMDSLKSGIGTLVDTDMEAASARLQALQVQQQLGIQSLSIANQAPQSVLSLFR